MSTTVLPIPVGKRRVVTDEPGWVRWVLIGLALAFLALFLFIPLILVFYEALKKAWMSTWPPSRNPMQ